MGDLATTLGASLQAPTGHNLTTLYYKGQPCWIAQEIGQALGYAENGSKLVNKITQSWTEEAIEGEDFFKIEGEELAEIKVALGQLPTESVGSQDQLPPDSGGSQGQLGPDSGPSQPGSRSRHLLLLTEQGVYLACIKSNKPAGVQLRRWLVSEVLPALRQTGTYTTTAAKTSPKPPPCKPRQLAEDKTVKTRISIDVPEELAEELRAICFWRSDQLTRVVNEALEAWTQERRDARDFFIDPKTRQPIEKPPGEPYPARTGELKAGRPHGS